jgi:hypothetical protein
MDVFSGSNPEAVEYLTRLYGFYTDLGSHLDMLHESPNCMGIAWDYDNVYWVFDGYEGSIVRYDFAEDHGMGFDDHSDGIISRYVVGQVKRVRGVMSHLVLDHDTGLLYVSDTGNGRIVVLDTNTGTRGETRFSMEPGTDHHEVDGATFTNLVTGLNNPSGIALAGDVLVVSENGTGGLRFFDLDGTLLRTYDTGLDAGALAGVWADDAGDVWFLDGAASVLYRLAATTP